MERRDWALLAICAADGTPLGDAHLMKSLFLLGRNMPGEVGRGFYKFRPYKFGPYDSAVTRDAIDLGNSGLVSVSPGHSTAYTYTATDTGAQHAEVIGDEASPTAAAYLCNVVTWAKALSFPQLLMAIYLQYPEMRRASAFQNMSNLAAADVLKASWAANPDMIELNERAEADLAAGRVKPFSTLIAQVDDEK
jgi:hypothetical protein